MKFILSTLILFIIGCSTNYSNKLSKEEIKLNRAINIQRVTVDVLAYNENTDTVGKYKNRLREAEYIKDEFAKVFTTGPGDIISLTYQVKNKKGSRNSLWVVGSLFTLGLYPLTNIYDIELNATVLTEKKQTKRFIISNNVYSQAPLASGEKSRVEEEVRLMARKFIREYLQWKTL